MKILISSYTGLGNFILKTPLINAIDKEYDSSQIDLIFGFPWGAENVLRDSELINKEYWLPPQYSIQKKINMFKFLRQQNYDIVMLPFDSSPNFILLLSVLFLNRSQMISHYSNHSLSIKTRLIKICIRLFLLKVIWVPVPNGRHEIKLNLDLLHAVNNNLSPDHQTFINWKSENISGFNLPELYLVIQPLAANGGPTPKTWSPENFDKLIDEFLLKFPKMKVVLVGDAGDAGDVSKLKTFKMLSNSNVINLLSKTTFNQLCNVLSNAQAIIAHDSGIMHVANALQLPLLALYGPTDYTRTAPLAPSSHVLHSRTECWRKMYGFKNSEKKLAKQYPCYYCMSGISVNQVMDILKILLQKKVL